MITKPTVASNHLSYNCTSVANPQNNKTTEYLRVCAVDCKLVYTMSLKTAAGLQAVVEVGKYQSFTVLLRVSHLCPHLVS